MIGLVLESANRQASTGEIQNHTLATSEIIWDNMSIWLLKLGRRQMWWKSILIEKNKATCLKYINSTIPSKIQINNSKKINDLRFENSQNIAVNFKLFKIICHVIRLVLQLYLVIHVVLHVMREPIYIYICYAWI